MYPGEIKYRHSVENKTYPPDNGGYKFTAARDSENEVVFSSGNIAVVFKVTDDADNKVKALKLFTKESADRFETLSKISIKLKSLKSEYFVDFSFVAKLIYVYVENQPVNENFFPGVVMDWVDGVTLGFKIKELSASKDITGLTKLKNNFRDLSLFLIQSKIGHGDLKHDNILVKEDLKLVLVDYDGIFIEEFTGARSTELGTDSFQHPARTANDFNERIDEFSILSIYTSLLSLTLDPVLYERYEDQQNLLFTLEDFKDPVNSSLFKELSNKDETKHLVYHLKRSLTSDNIYIDNIVDLLHGKFPVPEISVKHTPAVQLAGETVRISWQTENSDYITVNGKPQPLHGFLYEKISEGFQLLFEYGNEPDSNRYLYRIEPAPKPVIKSFKIARHKIKVGEAVNLSFDFQNASKAVILYKGTETDVTAQNSYTVADVKESAQFILQVFGLNSQTIISAVADVEVIQPVAINFFESDPRYIVQTKPVILRWQIINATSATIIPGNINALTTDFTELKPNSSTTYRLVARNEMYEAAEEINVEVFSIQIPRVRFPTPPELNLDRIQKLNSRLSLGEHVEDLTAELHRNLQRELKVRDKDIFSLLKSAVLEGITYTKGKLKVK